MNHPSRENQKYRHFQSALALSGDLGTFTYNITAQ